MDDGSDNDVAGYCSDHQNLAEESSRCSHCTPVNQPNVEGEVELEASCEVTDNDNDVAGHCSDHQNPAVQSSRCTHFTPVNIPSVEGEVVTDKDNDIASHCSDHQNPVLKSSRRIHFTPVNRPIVEGQTVSEADWEDLNDSEDDFALEIDETVYTWSPEGGYRSGVFSHELPDVPSKSSKPMTSAQKARLDYRQSKPVVPPNVKRATSQLWELAVKMYGSDGANDRMDELMDEDQESDDEIDLYYSALSEADSYYKEKKLLNSAKSKKNTRRSARASPRASTPPKAKWTPKRKPGNAKAQPATPASVTRTKRKAKDAGVDASPSKSAKVTHNAFSSAAKAHPPPAFNINPAPSATGLESKGISNGPWRFMDIGLGDSYTDQKYQRAFEPLTSTQHPSRTLLNQEHANEDDGGWADEDSVNGDNYEDKDMNSDGGEDSDFRSSTSSKRGSRQLSIPRRKVTVRTRRRQRSPRPPLTKWNELDWKKALLGVVGECGLDGNKINFTRAAKWIGPTVTGSAFQQALLKLRDKLIKSGECSREDIPPIRMAWTKNKQEDALVKEGKLVIPSRSFTPPPRRPMVDAGVQVMMIRLPVYHREDPRHQACDQSASQQGGNSQAGNSNGNVGRSNQSDSLAFDGRIHQSTGLWQPGNPPLLLTQPFTPTEPSNQQIMNLARPQITGNANILSQSQGYGQMPNSYSNHAGVNPYSQQPTMFNNAGYTGYTGNYPSSYHQNPNNTARSNTLSEPEVNNVTYDNSQYGSSALSASHANNMSYGNNQYGGSAFGSQYGNQNAGVDYTSQNMAMGNTNFQGSMGYGAGGLDQNTGVGYTGQAMGIGNIDFQTGREYGTGASDENTGMEFADQTMELGNIDFQGGMQYSADFADGATSPEYNMTSNQSTNNAFGNSNSGMPYNAGLNLPLANGARVIDGVVMVPFIWPSTSGDNYPAAINSSTGINQSHRPNGYIQTLSQAFGAQIGGKTSVDRVDPSLLGFAATNVAPVRGHNTMLPTSAGLNRNSIGQPTANRTAQGSFNVQGSINGQGSIMNGQGFMNGRNFLNAQDFTNGQVFINGQGPINSFGYFSGNNVGQPMNVQSAANVNNFGQPGYLHGSNFVVTNNNPTTFQNMNSDEIDEDDESSDDDMADDEFSDDDISGDEDDDALHGPGVRRGAGFSFDGACDDMPDTSADQSDSADKTETSVDIDDDEDNIDGPSQRELEAMRSAEIRLIRQGLLTEAWWKIFPGPESVWGGSTAKDPQQSAPGNVRQKPISEMSANRRRYSMSDVSAKRTNASKSAESDKENIQASSRGDCKHDADETDPKGMNAALQLVAEFAKRFEGDPRC